MGYSTVPWVGRVGYTLRNPCLPYPYPPPRIPWVALETDPRNDSRLTSRLTFVWDFFGPLLKYFRTPLRNISSYAPVKYWLIPLKHLYDAEIYFEIFNQKKKIMNIASRIVNHDLKLELIYLNNYFY